MRVPHGDELAAARGELLVHAELRPRVHEVAVAARAREPLRIARVVAVGDVRDRDDLERAPRRTTNPHTSRSGSASQSATKAGEDSGP